MAQTAEISIRQQYGKDISIEIEIVKEPDNIAMGTATGIM
jgi:hypothetical protein